MTKVVPTADTVAHGLIAICDRFGSDPLGAFTDSGGGRARACVGAALVQLAETAGEGRGATRRVAHMLKLPATRLAPSGLKRSDISILDVAAALKAMTGQVQAASVLSQPMTIKAAARRPAAFDPAVLRRAPTIKPAVAADTVARPRDVDTEAFVGLADDTHLVEACRRQGGFPIVHLSGPQRGLRSWPDGRGRHV